MFTKTEQLLFNSQYKGIPGVFVIDQGNPGPNVAIFSVTHGNEIAGFESLLYLLEQENMTERVIHGKLFLIVHNIKAYQGYREAILQREVGQTEFRYMDVNLNRVYRDTYLNNPEYQNAYEVQRAKEIQTIIPELDGVLDLHSTSSPSDPFLLSAFEKEDMEVADQLFFYRHIYDILDFVPGSLNAYANDYGRQKGKTVSIGVECGSHFEKSSKYCAQKTTLRFLSAMGSIRDYKEMNDRSTFTTSKYRILHNLMPEHDTFAWTKSWKSFELLKRGEVVATENGKEYSYDDDYILIMPTANPMPGGDGVYLAKSVR